MKNDMNWHSTKLTAILWINTNMNKHAHTLSKYSTTLIFLLFSSELFADELISKTTNADYHELCNIYREVVNKSIDLGSKEGMLVEKTQKRLPVLFNELYKHAMYADSKDR
ncbi:hypothetical protein MNBD_GAMMA08-979, partial [hydrothermal vent metagenome]